MIRLEITSRRASCVDKQSRVVPFGVSQIEEQKEAYAHSSLSSSLNLLNPLAAV